MAVFRSGLNLGKTLMHTRLCSIRLHEVDVELFMEVVPSCPDAQTEEALLTSLYTKKYSDRVSRCPILKRL